MSFSIKRRSALYITCAVAALLVAAADSPERTVFDNEMPDGLDYDSIFGIEIDLPADVRRTFANLDTAKVFIDVYAREHLDLGGCDLIESRRTHGPVFSRIHFWQRCANTRVFNSEIVASFHNVDAPVRSYNEEPTSEPEAEITSRSVEYTGPLTLAGVKGLYQRSANLEVPVGIESRQLASNGHLVNPLQRESGATILEIDGSITLRITATLAGFAKVDIKHREIPLNDGSNTDEFCWLNTVQTANLDCSDPADCPNATSRQWVTENGQVASGGCTYELGIAGASYGIAQVQDANSTETTKFDLLCNENNVEFNACVGDGCVLSTYHRQQTAYEWIKRARDTAKSYGYSVITPTFNQVLNVNIDEPQSNVISNCNGNFVGCYNPSSNTVFAVKDYEITRNPGFLGHETGHWWVDNYEMTNASCRGLALHEGAASVLNMAMMKRTGSSSRYATTWIAVGCGTLVESWGQASRPRSDFVLPPTFCNNAHSYAKWFTQSFWEIINDVNCGTNGCSATASSGPYDGTGGIGWTSALQARSLSIEALSDYLDSCIYNCNLTGAANHMVAYMAAIDANIMGNVKSVFANHGH